MLGEEPIGPSFRPSIHPHSPQPQLASPSPVSMPMVMILPGVDGEVSRPTTAPNTERGYWVSTALNTHNIPSAIKLGEPPFSLLSALLGHLWNPKG